MNRFTLRFWKRAMGISGFAVALTLVVIPLALLLPIYSLAGKTFTTDESGVAIDSATAKLHQIQTLLMVDRVLTVVAIVCLVVSIVGLVRISRQPK